GERPPSPREAVSRAVWDRGCVSCRNLPRNFLGHEWNAAAAAPCRKERAVSAGCAAADGQQHVVGTESAMDEDALVTGKDAGVCVRRVGPALRAIRLGTVEPAPCVRVDEELRFDLPRAFQIGERTPRVLVEPGLRARS